MQLMRELELVNSTLNPDVDVSTLKIRYEEILNNYSVKKKTSEDLKDDMISNINMYISAKKLEGLSELTLIDYERELVLFKDFVNKTTASVTTADIREYLASNPEIMSSTSGKKLSVIKSFFSWMVEEDLILKNPVSRIKQIKNPDRLPKALTEIELEILRESCETNREKALVETMYSTGCRLSEVSGMKVRDVDWTRGSIKVIGKGNKERIAYLTPKASHRLKIYLEERKEDENNCEYLFSTIRRPYRRMQNKTIQDLINKITDKADLDKNVTPHVLRHTFATLAMENGIELGDLQQLMGHSNPGTTLRYAEVSEERKYNAHKRFI